MESAIGAAMQKVISFPDRANTSRDDQDGLTVQQMKWAVTKGRLQGRNPLRGWLPEGPEEVLAT